MTSVLDDVFAQAAQQYQNGLTPALYVGISASTTRPWQVPPGSDPIGADPIGADVLQAGDTAGGSGSGMLTYQPEHMILIDGKYPYPVSASFSGEAGYLAAMIADLNKDGPSLAGERAAVSVTIAAPPLFAGPGAGYFVNLSASPGVLDGGSLAVNASPPAAGGFELTGRFSTAAGAATGPRAKALQSDYLTVTVSVWMRLLAKAGPPPDGI